MVDIRKFPLVPATVIITRHCGARGATPREASQDTSEPSDIKSPRFASTDPGFFSAHLAARSRNLLSRECSRCSRRTHLESYFLRPQRTYKKCLPKTSDGNFPFFAMRINSSLDIIKEFNLNLYYNVKYCYVFCL